MATRTQISWRADEFKLGINMAGAISAGAYTAGVLDFLMEALEEWEKAKVAFRAHLAKPSAPAAPPVPLHDVTIEGFGGASAGGMCAAIAAVMVQRDFAHIRNAMETGTTNTLYESWVNRVDISHLLGTGDIANGQPLVSLLDSTVIDEIAGAALRPEGALERSYISPHLTLLLTLTNVRGVPYRLYTDPTATPGENEPTADEFTAYYGDQLRFEATTGNAAPLGPLAKPLPAGLPDAGAWPLLEEAAKATGAFPIVLAPRQLTRDKGDYIQPPWESTADEPHGAPPSPAWPAQPATLETLNVDGGVTDNNPFHLVDDLLFSLQNPRPEDSENPAAASESNCAVLTVAPFPATNKFDREYDPQKASGIWPMLGSLLDVLLSQSRFMGESLSVLTEGAAFNRFVIAPSDPKQLKGSALQCGLLNAFGGFFYRGFRRHDFLLGRRNCQRFLRAHLCLPAHNLVMAAGLRNAGTYADAVLKQFAVPPPVSQSSGSAVWIPLIPVLGTADAEVPAPAREQMPESQMDDVINQVLDRAKAIRPLLLADAPSFLRWIAGIVLRWPFSIPIKGALRSALKTRLGENVAAG